MSKSPSKIKIKCNLFDPARTFIAVLITAIFWLYPSFLHPSLPNSEKNRRPLQEYGGIHLVSAIADTAPNCDKSCQIDVCVDWVPGPSPACPKPGKGGGCCNAYETQCDPACSDPIPTLPPTISAVLNCSQSGSNGWCIGSLSIELTASDPQGQSVLISGALNGNAFACPQGATFCSVPISTEGLGTITYRVDSATGLYSDGLINYQLDYSKPSLNGTLSGVTAPGNWYISNATLNILSSDLVSGLALTTAAVDGGAPLPVDSPITLTDGLHTIILAAIDVAGNNAQITKTIQVDTLTPVISISINGTKGVNDWYISKVIITATANDSSSGISTLEMAVDGGLWTTANNSMTFSDGIHIFQFRATDKVGHVTESSLQTIKVDTTTPAITTSVSGTSGVNGWYVSSATISPTATDGGSGIASLEVSTDGESWAEIDSPLMLADGIHAWQFRATDYAGNITETASRTIMVDTIKPVLTTSIKGVNGSNGWYASVVEVSLSAHDENSGLVSLEAAIDGGLWTKVERPLLFADGIHTYQSRATDNAGNITETLPRSIKVDTTTPLVNLNVMGKLGVEGWYVSEVAVNPIVSDPTSGVASIQAMVDNGIWATINTPLSLADGIHHYQFKVTDSAGNSTTIPIQNLKVDTVAPSIEMTEDISLGETVFYQVEDHGSGLSTYRVVIEDDDEKYKKIVWLDSLDGNILKDQVLWDGKFADGRQAGWGRYFISLKISDKAGNEAIKSSVVDVNPLSFLQDIPDFAPPPSTSVPVPATQTESTSLSFGGEIKIDANGSEINITNEGGDSNSNTNSYNPEIISGEQTIMSNEESIANTVSDPASSTNITLNEGGNLVKWIEDTIEEVSFSVKEVAKTTQTEETGILWGITATALAGATLADWQKKREEEDRKQQEKSGDLRARREAEKAQNAAIREKRSAKTISLSQKTKVARIEKAEGLAIATQQAERIKNREQARQEQEQAKLQSGLMAYYLGRKAGEIPATTPQPVEKENPKWWEKAIDWIDQHQVEISVGIGVVVGVAAIIASGGVAAPWVMAAWITGAAAVAGGTVALGTVGLNGYYGRPLGDNVLRNLLVAGTTAAALTGAGFLFQGAIQGVGSYCVVNPSVCAKAEPVLNTFDTVEESWLMLKGSYQTWMGDSAGAADTYAELQMEQMDGGIPGNSVLKDLGEDTLELIERHGDDVLPLVLKYGDDAVDIIGTYGDDGVSLLIMYGDDATKLIKEYGNPAVDLMMTYGDDAIELSNKYGDDVFRVLDGGFVKVDIGDVKEFASDFTEITKKNIWISPATGTVYLSKSDEDALKASRLLKTTYDQKKIDELVKVIAIGSTRGTGNRVVLGAWQEADGYIEEAVDNGGIFFDTGKEVWDEVRESNIDPWLINKQFLQNQLESGIERLDYVGENIFDVIGSTDVRIRDSYRAKEIKWLLKNAKNYGYIRVGNSWILP